MQVVAKRAVASLLVTLSFAGISGQHAFAVDYGTLSGQFVLQGDIPERGVLVKKGDQNVKDAAVCAANEVLNDELIVDPETKGIANVFIYLRKIDKAKIHPDLVATPEDKKEIVFDQKNCHFSPHTLFVRTDQTVVVKSGDDCAHNTHTSPLRNAAQNFIVQPNDRVGIKLTLNSPEFLPIPVKCDIHGWMMAHWLILDHPYAAITDEKGNFKIENLPAGTHMLRVWHERIGYVNVDKTFHWSPKSEDNLTVKIEGPELKLAPIAIPVERLTAKK